MFVMFALHIVLIPNASNTAAWSVLLCFKARYRNPLWHFQRHLSGGKGPVCKIHWDLLTEQRQKGNITFINMFSLVYNHLKQRIIAFSLSQNEPFISTRSAGPVPQWLPYCTAICQQQPQSRIARLLSTAFSAGERCGSTHYYSATGGKMLRLVCISSNQSQSSWAALSPG